MLELFNLTFLWLALWSDSTKFLNHTKLHNFFLNKYLLLIYVFLNFLALILTLPTHFPSLNFSLISPIANTAKKYLMLPLPMIISVFLAGIVIYLIHNAYKSLPLTITASFLSLSIILTNFFILSAHLFKVPFAYIWTDNLEHTVGNACFFLLAGVLLLQSSLHKHQDNSYKNQPVWVIILVYAVMSIFVVSLCNVIITGLPYYSEVAKNTFDADQINISLKQNVTIGMLLSLIGAIGMYYLLRSLAHYAKEQHLRAEREKAFNNKLIESAPDGIIQIDLQGKVIDVNDAICKIFKKKHSELIGRELTDIISSKKTLNKIKDFASIIKKDSIDTNAIKAIECLGIKEEIFFPIEITCSDIKSSEEERIILFVRDVTKFRETQKQMQETIKERELLLKEVHHRVKNNLQLVISLLNLQVGNTSDSAIKNSLSDSQNRIQSIAMVHELLYRNGDVATIDMHDYIELLSDKLVLSASRKNININIDADKVQLQIDYTIPCGLILNELITNCLQHAFPDGRKGIIEVEFNSKVVENDETECKLSVTDNGIGLANSQIYQSNSSSLGVRLIQSLVTQLNGSIETNSKNGMQVIVAFRAKINKI